MLLNYLSLNAKSLLCSPQIFVTVIFQKGIHVRGTIHPGGDAPPVRVRRSCPFTAQVQLPERPAAAGKRISALSRGLQRQPSARNDGRHPESITPPGPSRIFTLELAITARENKSILGKNISRMYRNQLWCFFFPFCLGGLTRRRVSLKVKEVSLTMLTLKFCLWLSAGSFSPRFFVYYPFLGGSCPPSTARMHLPSQRGYEAQFLC